MITLTPRAHGIDLSKYDLHFTPENAVNQLDFAIQRVSYRLTRDEAFAQLVDAVMRVPIRGGYHYLNSDTDWKAQADKFIAYASPFDYHFYVCDFEAAFNVLSTGFAYSAWKWIQYVKQQTGKPVMLYTNFSNYQDYIAPSERVYGIDWDMVPFWQAQYFNVRTPNGTPSTPAGRTAPWKIWQYTDNADGTLYGMGRATAGDLDVFNGTVQEMRAWLGVEAPEPSAVEHTTPFSGVDYFKGQVNGVNYYVLLIDLAGKRAYLNHAPWRETLSSVARRTGAHLAVNADDWNKHLAGPWLTSSLSYSNGQPYQTTQLDGRPYLNISKTNGMAMAHVNPPANPYNLTSFTRYLVRGGVKESYLSDPLKIENLEVHARSAKGIHRDGRLMLICTDGVYPSTGTTLPQLADLFLQYGSQSAGESGGGGDVGMWIGSGLVTGFSDPTERATVQQLLIYTGATMVVKNKVTVTWDNGARERQRPRVSTLDTYNAVLADNTVHYSDFDIVPDMDYPNDPTKRWIQLESGWYIAVAYGGYVRATVEPIAPPPPPPPAPADVLPDVLWIATKPDMSDKREYRKAA